MIRNLTALIMSGVCAMAWPPAQAQNVYRCGDTYSQRPCPGGALVLTDDPRSAEQRSDAREAAQRAARMADALEKARLREEAKAAVYVPPAAAEPEPEPEVQRVGVARPKKPPYFTAHAPRKPGDPPPRKKGKKKQPPD
jgi:hypothetical protein